MILDSENDDVDETQIIRNVIHRSFVVCGGRWQSVESHLENGNHVTFYRRV
jgi:hypothetical protein